VILRNHDFASLPGVVIDHSENVVINDCHFGRRKWRFVAVIEAFAALLQRWLGLIMLVFIAITLAQAFVQYERLQSQNRMTAAMIELGKRVDILKARPAQIGSPR
jgi:hypothetical protein